jgi:hypothetical protein
MFLTALFTTARRYKEPKLRINRSGEKKERGQPYSGILLSHNKE